MIHLKVSSWQILSVCDNKGLEMDRLIKYVLLPSLRIRCSSVQDNINLFLKSLGFYNNSPFWENYNISRVKSWLVLFCPSNTRQFLSKQDIFMCTEVPKMMVGITLTLQKDCGFFTCFPVLLCIIHLIGCKNQTHKSVVPWFPLQMRLHW